MIGITKKELDEVTELVNTLDMRKLNDNSRFNKILDKIQKNILNPKKKTKTKKTKTKKTKTIKTNKPTIHQTRKN